MPGERDQADEYSVSRIAVSKAIEGLVIDGLPTRRRGMGTFVAGRVEKRFFKLRSFSEDMRARGRRPSSSWVSKSAGMVNPEEAMALGPSPGERVLRFQRVRYADDLPTAFETSTIEAYCLASVDDVGDPLNVALRVAGHRPVRALQRLRAVPFGAERARMRGAEPGHAGLLIERRSFLHDGRAVDITRSHYSGDGYDFVAGLSE